MTNALWPLSDRGRSVVGGLLGTYGVDYLFLIGAQGLLVSCGGQLGPSLPRARTLRDLIHPEEYPPLWARVSGGDAGTPVPLPPFRVRGPEDGWHWLQGSSLNLLEHPEVGVTVLSAHDVTALKAAQLGQDALGTLLRQTTAGQGLRHLLADLVRTADEQVPHHFCAVFLWQDGLRLAAAPGAPQDFAALFPDWPEDAPAPATGPWAAGSMPAQVTPAALAAPLRRRGVAEVMSMPLLGRHGQYLGAVALYRRLVTVATEQHRLTRQLDHQAYHDMLTGLPNRRLFTERLRRTLGALRPPGQRPGLMFLDLDHFKEINDTLGHPAGDEVLRLTAGRLAACLRPHETLARLAQRLLAALSPPLRVGEAELYLGASIGILLATDPGQDVQTALRYADIAMYRAKQRRNTFVFFEAEMTRQSGERLHLVSLLRRAVPRPHETFGVLYQPQGRLEDGVRTGSEALLRWTLPDRGPVPPDLFIPLAEETGLIVPLGEWVLAQACAHGAAWSPGAALSVAVNVSALQFTRTDFAVTVRCWLERSGLDPTRLELELTERVVLDDVGRSAARMAELRALGVRLALDDFGTGYSSLSCLSRLPLDTLKVDRSFVRGVHADAASGAVVRAIVGLARSFGLRTVAEGIETPEEYRALRDLGCETGQGYLLGLPEAPAAGEGAGPSGAARPPV
ncbi:EAL domain-containing protein [uncultured Deinococcus sp.]|uniref:putative bifunctional diguanylate cyclase/phosphodiesterase n=1 Tax=uncultured Deinococcus sp. TaxID=158789 RepID=UPI00259122AA|nr:EAL domain-containing protein [uncultured Deinococcus sp.]